MVDDDEDNLSFEDFDEDQGGGGRGGNFEDVAEVGVLTSMEEGGEESMDHEFGLSFQPKTQAGSHLTNAIQAIIKSVEFGRVTPSEFYFEGEFRPDTNQITSRSTTSTSTTGATLPSIASKLPGIRGGLHRHRQRHGAALAWIVSDDLKELFLYEQQQSLQTRLEFATNPSSSQYANSARQIAIWQFDKPISCVADAVLVCFLLRFDRKRDLQASLVLKSGSHRRLCC